MAVQDVLGSSIVHSYVEVSEAVGLVACDEDRAHEARLLNLSMRETREG